jgi:hypothetical protein
MIMSIPILMVLQYILEEYASKTPGLASKPIENKAAHSGFSAEESANLEIHQSDFAKVIRRTVSLGNGEKNSSRSEIAHYAYAGKWLFKLVILCHIDHSNHLSGPLHLSTDFYFFFLPIFSFHLVIFFFRFLFLSSCFFIPNAFFILSFSLSIVEHLGYLTPQEEALTILGRVRTFLAYGDLENYCLPWEVISDTDPRAKERGAKTEAIEEHMGVFPDGTFVPLTLRQRLFFASPLKKLEYKIAKVRKLSDEVVELVSTLETSTEDAKDIALLREFILECLSPFKRHSLVVNNHAYDEAAARRVSWPVYITSWIIITGSLLFFIYWIFAWGVYQGDTVLGAWGAIFGTGAAGDIIFVQVTKIVILYYLPALAMQPQLLRIRNVLADISMNYINRQHTSYSQSTPIEKSEDISIIQYMSAACRAARSSELHALPSAWLLRQVPFLLTHAIS